MKMRRDAQRNRIRILAAATEVFRERGVEAPLDHVASRAKVGRGTLYRHFPNRAELVVALIERRLTALEEFATAYPGEDLLEHLLVEMCELQIRIPRLLAVVGGNRETPGMFNEVVARTRALLAAAVEIGQRAGAVRPDITVEDTYLLITMIDSTLDDPGSASGPFAHERAITLLLRSIRSDRRLNLDPPAPRIDQNLEASANSWSALTARR